jgi:hypothetical protein
MRAFIEHYGALLFLAAVAVAVIDRVWNYDRAGRPRRR